MKPGHSDGVRVSLGEVPRKHARLALALILALGVLTFLPALRSPFLLDDYLHQSMVDGVFPSKRGPFDLYDFVSDGDRAVLADRGILPWWIHPRLTIRFFRPLSSLLLWGDHRLAGSHPLLLHLHSLAWWVAAVFAARALYRRFFSDRVVLLATAIFALAPCHTLPLAWLANREALVSLVFGALGLGAYVRFRDERHARDALAAGALFLLSVLGGEYGLAFAGYVLAVEFVRPKEAWGARFVGVLPFALPTAAYLVVRSRLHYGTVGSGFYSDPLSAPWTFLSTAPVRLMTLLVDSWITVDAETWPSSTPTWVLAAFFLVVAGALFLPLRRVFAQLDPATRRTASWLVLGSVLSLAPTLAVVPSSRLLGVSYIGVAAVIALLLDHVWFPSKLPSVKDELLQNAAVLLGFAHLIHGPVTGWLIGRRFQQSAVEFPAHTRVLREILHDPAHSDVVLVRGLSGQFFAPFALDEHGRPPARWRVLAHAGHVLVMRTDAHTLRLATPKDKTLFPAGAGNLFRSPDLPLAVGDEVQAPGVRITIEAVGSQGPSQATFEFDQDLDDSTLTWMVEDTDGFKEAALPPVGFGKPFDP